MAKVEIIDFVAMNPDSLIVLRFPDTKLPLQNRFMARFIYSESRRK